MGIKSEKFKNVFQPKIIHSTADSNEVSRTATGDETEFDKDKPGDSGKKKTQLKKKMVGYR